VRLRRAAASRAPPPPVEKSASGDDPSPALGARVVARAWIDAEFRARLLADPVNALVEYQSQAVPIAVLEDTPVFAPRDRVHVVLLLSRWSPRQSAAVVQEFRVRSRVVREPRAVLAEFGMEVEPHVELRVHDSTAELRYIVLPLRPAGTEIWSEEQLATLVTRDSMIGTGRPLTP
jgi:nitrile hydratase